MDRTGQAQDRRQAEAPLVAVGGLLIVVATLVAEQRLQGPPAQ